jgi:hypothetical protein
MSKFGHILPELAKKHQVIAGELQAHEHTPDLDHPLSFEQDADDVPPSSSSSISKKRILL